MNEDDKDSPWEFTKVFKHSQEKGVDGNEVIPVK
jgi:hypothetical protein